MTVLTVKPLGITIIIAETQCQHHFTAIRRNRHQCATIARAQFQFDPADGVIYSITNLFNGSNITGTAAVTPGTSGGFNWSFTVTPFPGTNILSVQSVDVSGDISPIVSRTFFYEVPARLTILTTGKWNRHI